MTTHRRSATPPAAPRRARPREASPAGRAAWADCPRRRITELVGELRALVALLEERPLAKRHLVYARCIPLLTELSGQRGDSLPLRELNSLIHEAGWHLRSLAGLASLEPRRDDQHAVWARTSLDRIAACAGAGDAPRGLA